MNRRLITVAAVALATLSGTASASAQQPDPLSEYIPPQATSAASPRATAAGAQAQASGNRSSKLAFGYGDPLFNKSDALDRERAFREAGATNADVVRLKLNWRTVAPSSPSTNFNATDPSDPEYNWSGIDAGVTGAVAGGFTPMIMVNGIPDWVEGDGRPSTEVAPAGSWKPNPSDVRDFAVALARRYSGGFQGLPRVSRFLPLNEPNLPTNLTPQWKGKKGTTPASPALYVKVLNAFYEGANSVDKKNTVITAGTAPYGFPDGEYSMRPMIFWREALCVKGQKKPKARKRCKVKAKFDVLAHHPINTSGGPDRSALSPDDVSTPDLHNLIDVLRAAEKGENVLPKRKKRPVWATEIWWESNPPDRFPGNPSLKKQARWYTEALHSLWQQGASMVLLFQVRDERPYGPPGRYTGSSYETGVYFSDWTPKPSARAVSFPFLAERKSKKKVLLWGRAPASGSAKIVNTKGKGKRVAKFKVKAGQVFEKRVRLKGKAKLQASVGGIDSAPWKPR